MIFFKKKDKSAQGAVRNGKVDQSAGMEAVATEKGLFQRLREGLSKTRSHLTGRLDHLLLGRKEIVTHGGMDHQVTIDEAFIRSKLLTPENSRIKGFPPIMPSQKGVLTDAEIDAIIRYIKTL